MAVYKVAIDGEKETRVVGVRDLMNLGIKKESVQQIFENFTKKNKVGSAMCFFS